MKMKILGSKKEETPSTGTASTGTAQPDTETPEGENPNTETPDGETPNGETPDGESGSGEKSPGMTRESSTQALSTPELSTQESSGKTGARNRLDAKLAELEEKKRGNGGKLPALESRLMAALKRVRQCEEKFIKEKRAVKNLMDELDSKAQQDVNLALRQQLADYASSSGLSPQEILQQIARGELTLAPRN